MPSGAETLPRCLTTQLPCPGRGGVIALMCSPPPRARSKRTLRLLEYFLGELNIVAVGRSQNTIGRTPKKSDLKPHPKKQYVIPPEGGSAAFVANMEETCRRSHHAAIPMPRCLLDETSKQLIAQIRVPIGG